MKRTHVITAILETESSQNNDNMDRKSRQKWCCKLLRVGNEVLRFVWHESTSYNMDLTGSEQIAQIRFGILNVLLAYLMLLTGKTYW